MYVTKVTNISLIPVFNNAINCNTSVKRLFYNTRFILFSIGCKYVFMPLTELTQHGNDELLTTSLRIFYNHILS